jgi:hypothetical protein
MDIANLGQYGYIFCACCINLMITLDRLNSGNGFITCRSVPVLESLSTFYVCGFDSTLAFSGETKDTE